MALRPLIVKHAFYLPGKSGFGKGNHGAVAHLQYMGDPSRHQKTDEELLMGSAAVHAKYMTERPGVSGYFGPDPRTLPDIERIQKTLELHTGPIWRDFISVTETDAVALGGSLMTREGWEAAARAQLPKMFQSMGLNPANVEWVASVHKKEGHPHMHLLFWEREPTRIKGQWSDKERIQIRRDWASELYRPERERLGEEKSALRQQILTEVKAQDLGVLPARVQKEWTARLSALAEHLPSHGRKALKYMPPEVKEEARATAEWLTATIPAFRKTAARYGDLAAEMAQHYSDNPLSREQARQNAMDDLTDRVSQLIIQHAAAFPKREMDPPEHRALVRDQIKEALSDPELKEAIKAATKDVQNNYLTKSEAITQLTAQVRTQMSASESGYIEEAIRQSITHRLEGRLTWFADQDRIKELMSTPKLQRMTTDKVVQHIIANDPEWHQRYLKASITPLVVPSQKEFTRRTVHAARPRLFMSPYSANSSLDSQPLTFSFSTTKPREPEGIQASIWNPRADQEAKAKRQQQVRDSLTQHVQSEKDWQARALYRHQHAVLGLGSIFGGMQAALHKAEADNHRAAFRRGASEAWIDEARAHGVSESRIAEIEMG